MFASKKVSLRWWQPPPIPREQNIAAAEYLYFLFGIKRDRSGQIATLLTVVWMVVAATVRTYIRSDFMMTLLKRVIKKLVSIRRRDGETTRRDDETRRRDETARRRDARIVGVQNPYRTFRIFGHHFLGHYMGQSKRRRDDETTPTT